MVNTEVFKDLYPFQSNFLELDSKKYHYLDEGEGDPLLMLHGNPTWSFYYRNLVIGLKDHFRCVVPDHMGCGLSYKPQEYDYTLSKHIDNLEKLVDELKLDNITLVMHDWGGAIGMGYAVRYPEKIKRLVIFNTSAFLSDHIPLSIDICRYPVIGPVAIRMFNAFAGAAVYRACKNRKRMTDKVKAGYLAPYDSFENRIANLRFVQDIPMTEDVPSYQVVKEMQGKLDLFKDRPALIMWGKKDFCFTTHFFERWKEYLPQAEAHLFRRAGHYVVEDAHDEIMPLIKGFLAESK